MNFVTGIVQAHFAFVRQHHDGRPGKHLGHRSDPEHVVFADEFLRRDVGVAEQILVANLAALVGDNADDARQFVAVQVRLHGGRHFRTGRWFAFSGGAVKGEGNQQQSTQQGLLHGIHRECLTMCLIRFWLQHNSPRPGTSSLGDSGAPRWS
jgi:hypothetical protein